MKSKFHSIDGLELAATSAGIYPNKRDDVVLIKLDDESKISVRLTQNAFAAAPVQITKKHLNSQVKYLLINAGNANAGNGQAGIDAALNTCKTLAKQANCSEENVLPFSTGVIGETFPTEKITQAIPNLLSQLSETNWREAAKAIMTTDTKMKLVSKIVDLDGITITITGMAKGAGMIKPNMATMLAYIATDADLSQAELDEAMDEAVNISFNRITVDGDTSTNDACVLISTAKHAFDKTNKENYLVLKEAINELYIELATAIIKDAEGATKFITVDVKDCIDVNEANKIAYSIAESPLVKTAFFASDPNWGRILAAIGKTNIKDIDIDRINIYLDDYCILKQGARIDTYDESIANQIMQKKEIIVCVEMLRGNASTRVWTSDLSHDYVTINAEYRT